MYFRTAVCAFLYLFGFVLESQAQPGFERVFGGLYRETANYIKPTPDHGYILIGTAKDPFYQTYAYYVLKLDSMGFEEWSKIYSNPLDAFGYAIVPTFDKGYAFVGSHIGIFYDGIAEIVTLDSLGDVTNSNTFPPADGWGTAGIGIIQTLDSNLAITAYTDGFISQNYYSLYKIAPDLSTSWTNFLSYDGSFVNVHDVIQEKDGSYFSLAYYDNFYYVFPNIPQATGVRKFAADGTLLVDSVFELHSISNSISPTSDSGVIISGYQDSLNMRNMMLTRLDLNASPLWQKSYVAPSGQNAVLTQQVSDGGFVILSTCSGMLANQNDIQLMKVNGLGDSLWSKTFGSYFDEHALHFEETADHGFVILGSTTSFNDSKIYVIKTDSLGNSDSQYQIVSSGNYFCEEDTIGLFIQPLPPSGSTILWSNGDTGDTILVNTSGNYSAQIIDSNGDTSRTFIHSVFFALAPVAQIALQDTLQLCRESLIRNLSAGDLSLHYQWYFNDTLIPGENSDDIIPQVSGNYALIISNYCGTDTAQVYIDSVFSLPSMPSLNAVSPLTICPGDSFRLAVLDTGFTYQWWEDSWLGMQTIPGAVDSVIYLHYQNNYEVQITDVNGCVAYSGLFFLMIDDAPVFVNASGSSSFCAGGQVRLTAPVGSDYLWSTGDTIAHILVDTAGLYYFSMMSIDGCRKYSDTLNVVVNALPAISLGPDTMVCDTSSVLLDAGVGFNYYLWQDASFDQTFLAFSPQMMPDSQDYFVLVTDTNGCANSDTIRVYFDICDQVSEFHSGNVQVYPNPATIGKGIQIIREDNSAGFYFLLYNESGSLVLSKALNEVKSEIIPTQNLSQGIYFYRIQSEKTVLGRGILVLQ